MRVSRSKIYLSISLFLYILFSIIFFELVLNFVTIKSFGLVTLFIKLLFIISISSILYGLSKLFKEKISFIVVSIMLFILSFIYASQIVYYNIFKTFYTFYSVLNSKQVLGLRSTALSYIVENIFSLIIIFIPFIFFLILNKRISIGLNLKSSIIGLVLGIVIHFIGVGAIYLTPHDTLSPFDFYFNVHEANSTIENIGLLNYMRLDVKRNLFDTKTIKEQAPPIIAEPMPETPVKPPEKEDAEKEEDLVEYNVMDIDFDKLIEEETDEELKTMHKYFSSVSPTNKNDHTGRFKDYNLILLTAESFSHLAIHQELTPTLYKMVHEGYNFKNFYTPIWGVSTSDGEYVANVGLIPKNGVWSFKESSNNNMYFSMGHRLGALGYSTRAYHNHTYTFYDRDKSHPNMGYDYKALGNGLDVRPTWPESDVEMMELTIPEYIDDEPFHTYYMTVSGHMLYTFDGNYMSAKNRDLVKDLDYSDPAKAYIAANIELDRALEYLLKKLEEKGIADNTLIAFSSDHYPYGLEHSTIEELEGKSVDDNFELYRNAFIVYNKNMEPETIEKPASSLDVIPTILNLMGIEYDSRLLMGRDIFSDSDPLVVFLNRSFITDKGRFNSKTKEFEGSQVEESYIKNMLDVVNAKFYYSAKILDLDYYDKLFKD